MSQRQFRSDDTDTIWNNAVRYGSGSDGALTVSGSGLDTTACDTFLGTSGGLSATVGTGTGFANGNLVLIHQTIGTGVGAWELNKLTSGGGSTSWTMAFDLCNTYTAGAQVYLLKQYSGVTINGSVNLSCLNYTGTTGGILAFLCNGTINITGGLVATGIVGSSVVQNQGGYRGGYGDTSGGNNYSGEGTQGASANHIANTGGSGGGADDNSSGGGGGNGTAGTSVDTRIGGVVSGVTNLTTMTFGGGGGGGGNGNGAGGGGNGAGIILLIAPTINGGGTITLNGGAGGSGGSGDSGGGGAGGSLLLKGQNITNLTISAN